MTNRTKLDAALEECRAMWNICPDDGKCSGCNDSFEAVKTLVREKLVKVQDQLWNQEYTPGPSPWGKFKRNADAILNEPEEDA